MILTRVKNEVGATAIEYGLIASLISVLAVSGMSAVGVNLSNTFCTISQHLGGSGTCSGGGSSVTGNGGIPAGSGSVNSTNSIEYGASIEKIEEGLNEELNLRNVPSSMGGGGSDSAYQYGHTYKSLFGDKQVTDINNALSGINSKDPITNVFGVYDTSNHFKPITDYSHVNDALQKGGGTITFGKNQSMNDTMQVTTASGKVWTVTEFGEVTENTKK